MHLCIVKLESGGQQLPVIKKTLSGNNFNLEKSSFSLKVLKNIRIYPNHRMVNSYTFALSRIKIKSLDSKQKKTKAKEKNLCIPYTAWKKIIFLSKNHKNTTFWPKMRNSQQVCIWIKKISKDKFRSNQKLKLILLHTLRNGKNWHFNEKHWKFTFFT